MKKSQDTAFRAKTILNNDQKNLLLLSFKKNMFPSSFEREILATKLSLKPRTVQIWFQNQRQKFKSYQNYVDEKFEKEQEKFKNLNLLANVLLDLDKRDYK